MNIRAEVLIALAALITSLIALIRGERFQKELRKSQSEHEARQSNASLLVDLWSRIGNKPSLLRFHEVTEEDLKKAGIDEEELAYLVASFEAAGYYYEYISKETGPFLQSSLRYNLCASQAIQKAWPLLKRFFGGSPIYTSRIEATLKLHEEKRQKTKPITTSEEETIPRHSDNLTSKSLSG